MNQMINCIEDMPMMLSANHLQLLGFTRPMAYQIMNRDDIAIVHIGKRKFIRKDQLLKWIERQEG